MNRSLMLVLPLFLLAHCGHTTTVLGEATPPVTTQTPTTTTTPDTNTTPPPSPTNNTIDWKQRRQTTAATPNNTVITPAAPTASFQESDPVKPLDAYIQQIVSFIPGPGYGYGASLLNELLLGPPFGGGQFSGSTDVVSLGNGGVITLGFPNYFPVNGFGPDFIVFENAFLPRGETTLFVEPAEVSVSQDGIHFTVFPCKLTPPYTGCAGTHYVNANPELNNINPRDPAVAGGDAYDLGDLGLNYIRFIRIRDIGSNAGGTTASASGQAGFDLDAISIVHGAKP